MAVPPIPILPLTEAERDGRYHAVSDGQNFAVARFHEGAWTFPGGSPVSFVPDGYLGEAPDA